MRTDDRAPVPWPSASASGDADPLRTLIRLGSLHTPMAVRVAATLRLVDHIQDGATTGPEMAARTRTHPGALTRLCRHLVAIGVLDQDADGGFRPTAVGRVLADDHPSNQRAWHDLGQAVARADAAFSLLLDAVRTGRPTYEQIYERTFYDDLVLRPRLQESFDELMTCDQDVAFDEPVSSLDWTGVRHVLDLGAGRGGFLAAIGRAAPWVTGTAVELAGPAGHASAYLAAQGLADRFDVVVGDIFDPPPCTADVVLLSFVLLNWSDADVRTLLRRARSALRPGGRLVVYERDDPPESAANEEFTELDLRMLVFLGGRLRTRDEWETIACDAGLAVEQILRIPSTIVPFDFSLIVLAAGGNNGARRPVPGAVSIRNAETS